MLRLKYNLVLCGPLRLLSALCSFNFFNTENTKVSQSELRFTLEIEFSGVFVLTRVNLPVFPAKVSVLRHF